jgi:hypothetical protein
MLVDHDALAVDGLQASISTPGAAERTLPLA